jgi:hypothetical protein
MRRSVYTRATPCAAVEALAIDRAATITRIITGRRARRGVDMSSGRTWGRRRFLRAAGVTAGAAALLPYIPRLVSADAPPARRLITFTMPMTSLRDEWTSNGIGQPFASDGSPLPPLAGNMLAPLAGHESKLVILDGVEPTLAGILHGIQLGPPGPPFFGTGHFVLPTLWTGTRQIPYGAVSAPMPPSVVGFTMETSAGGESIEQAVHRRLLTSAPHLQTLQLSCCMGSDQQLHDNQDCVSFAAPLTGSAAAPQLFPIADPQQAFDQFFGAIASTRPSARTRASVLDLVGSQMARLRAELPADDRARLEAHHQSIVDLEARIREGAARCILPPRPSSWSHDMQLSDPRGCARVMFEIVRLAFECDLVRCASFVCSTEQDGITPQAWDPTIPLTRPPDDNHLHALSHQQNDHDDARVVMRMFNRSMVACLADLVRTLESSQDTMSDTIIAVQGTMSDTALHASRMPPCLLVAGENTPIRTNQYVRFASMPADGVRGDTIDNNRLLTTLAHAMGLSDVTTFGEVGTYAPVVDPSGTTDDALPIQHDPIAEILR